MLGVCLKLPQIGEIWKHFKGGEYMVLDVVFCAEGDALDVRIIYGTVDPSSPKFSRSLANFLDPLPDGQSRFTYDR